MAYLAMDELPGTPSGRSNAAFYLGQPERKFPIQ